MSSSDPRVRAAIENWAPRFVAQGVDYNDFARTTARISTWVEWLPEWEATAEVHEQLGREAEDDGHHLSAGEAFVRAALCFHFAKFLWFEDEDRHWAATGKARGALERAHRHLDPTAERVEIPFEDASLAGILRRPAAADRAPLVLLLPGLDSTKEEFFHWESVFLARGLATFSLDGPGQGESGRRLPIGHDYEAAVTAALDVLSSRADVDAERVGAAGVSLGGYYVARAAAFEPRIAAAVAIGGPYNFGECWPRLSPLTRDGFRRHARAADDDEARAAAQRFDLEGVAEAIDVPLLVLFGKLDKLIPWEHADRLAREAPHATFVLYEEGNHVCNNIPYKYRPQAADWLADRL